jgi:SARP family transcriptional regulator, regulator of embCAB operon
MDYRILGLLEVTKDTEPATPTAPKTAGILALLLLKANYLVLAETLTEEIWSDEPPVSASTTLQTYIYQIRCALGRDSIVTLPGGYVFPVDDAQLDLLVFRTRVGRGQQLLDDGRPHDALDEMRSAMSLWRGRPLTNVRTGRILEQELAHLDEERRRAAELLIEAAFAAGRQREVIGTLKQMAAEDPYNEWLHARLIEALTLAGRRREALHVCSSLRKVLSEHLGLDPMQELRDLERLVLEG